LPPDVVRVPPVRVPPVQEPPPPPQLAFAHPAPVNVI
jgi:hypothetical protein